MSGSEQKNEGTAQSARLIKRYSNRKLYDTRDSRYVTLQQIAVYVRAGEEVRIIDNNTKEDLTNITLAQIVYENEKSGERVGGEGAAGHKLRDIIQRGGERFMTSLREGPVGKFVSQAPKAEEGEGAASRRPISRVVEQGKEALDELSRVADDRVRGLVSSAIGHVHHLQSEVGRLQARIDELEARLVRLQQRKRTGGESEPPDQA